MAVEDLTNEWVRALDGFDVFQSGQTVPVPPRNFAVDQLPAAPTAREWNEMRGQLRQLRDAVWRLGDNGEISLDRKSLFREPVQGPARYRLVQGHTRVLGRLYLLHAPPTAPFTPDLRRFVAFVPHTYSRNGDAGHYAWVHYTPVWGGARGLSPRARAAANDYPDGLWIHKYLVDYLLGHRLLASYAAARVNAILIMPVHRLTAVDALQPLSRINGLLGIVRELLIALEGRDRRFTAHEPSRRGSVEAVGASCYSFGAHPCATLFTNSGVPEADLSRLRAAAFLDGVTEHARRLCQDVFGSDNGERGWLAMPVPSSQAPRRIAFYQQQNAGRADFLAAIGSALRRHPPAVGEVIARTPNWRRNHGYVHRVDTTQLGSVARENPPPGRGGYMHWHGRIHALFMEEAFTFARDCFLW